MTDDRLLWLARMIGLTGLFLLVFSGIGGVLLASRTAQRLKLFKGKTFTLHRRFSLIGATLFLLHPIPILFAPKTTGGLNLLHVVVPFTAPKQSLWIGLGVIAAYLLLIVTISSLYIKKMKRGTWRALHYGTYLVLLLGLTHGLFISAEFREGEGLFSGEKKQEIPVLSEAQKEKQGGEKPGTEIKKDEGEIIDFEEPEKILLLIMAGVTLLFPVWRIVEAKKNRAAKTTLVSLLLLCALAGTARAQAIPPDAKPQAQDKPRVPAGNQDAPRTQPRSALPHNLTGTYVTTFNGSTLGRVAPSLNQRLNLDYALPKGRVIDLRLEYYTEGSYNADPPGQLIRNVNEPKFEGQVTYTHPLTSRFSLSGALLHHENFRFPDTYWWGIVTGTYTLSLRKNLILTANLSGEQRLSGGRPFVDFSGTLDYNFAPNWTLETSLHEYENNGASDPEPTHKQEYEFALLRQLPHKQFAGISFFRHLQFDAPNDQFSFVKLKYGISF